MEVLGGVFVLGRVAATDVTATQAQPEMDPMIAHLQAFLTAAGMRFYIPNLIQVGAFPHVWPLENEAQPAPQRARVLHQQHPVAIYGGDTEIALGK